MNYLFISPINLLWVQIINISIEALRRYGKKASCAEGRQMKK